MKVRQVVELRHQKARELREAKKIQFGLDQMVEFR
jgi:hypothetical protein